MIFSTRAQTRTALAGLMLALLLGIMPAEAQGTCPAEPAILSLADTVIEGRTDLPPLQARRFGAHAIYLTMQYGALPDGEIQDLLADAVENRTHNAEDLQFAWLVSHHGLERTLATLGSDAMERATSSAGLSSMRAMLLAGNWHQVMAAIAAKPETDQQNVFGPLLASIIDQPDPLKAEMGEAAAEHGLIWLAAGFAAIQADPEAWTRFVDGMSQADKDQYAQRWRYLTPLLGNPQLPVSTANMDARSVEARGAITLVSQASALQPDREFLMIVLNQTGDYARVAEAAELLIAQFDDGTLSQVAPLDAGWLATYRALRAAGYDIERLHADLASISITLNRRGPRSVGEAVDWLLATETLAPYATGTRPMPAKPPKTLSDRFTDWDHWLSLAGLVRSAPNEAGIGASEDDLLILAELLHAAGEDEALAKMIEAAPGSATRLAIAEDFAERLDRGCDARLAQKAEAVLLAGQPMFKFFSPLD